MNCISLAILLLDVADVKLEGVLQTSNLHRPRHAPHDVIIRDLFIPNTLLHVRIDWLIEGSKARICSTGDDGLDLTVSVQPSNLFRVRFDGQSEALHGKVGGDWSRFGNNKAGLKDPFKGEEEALAMLVTEPAEATAMPKEE